MLEINYLDASCSRCCRFVHAAVHVVSFLYTPKICLPGSFMRIFGAPGKMTAVFSRALSKPIKRYHENERDKF